MWSTQGHLTLCRAGGKRLAAVCVPWEPPPAPPLTLILVTPGACSVPMISGTSSPLLFLWWLGEGTLQPPEPTLSSCVTGQVTTFQNITSALVGDRCVWRGACVGDGRGCAKWVFE